MLEVARTATLQLIVVVFNAPTKFCDNLFKLAPYTIIIYKVGDTRCHLTGPDQRAAKKMRPGHCTKKNPSWESWGDLSGDRYIICPKPPSPAGKILDRRQLFFLANHNSPEQTPHTRLNLNVVVVGALRTTKLTAE